MRSDSSGLATFTCLYILIKRVKLLTEKRTVKGSFLSRKQRENESLTGLLSQSIIWTILTSLWLAYFSVLYQRLVHGWRHFYSFGNKVWLANARGNYSILYHKTNEEGSTVLCSVVKHLGSVRALKKWGKALDYVSCLPLHFFRALSLPACFTTEQTTVEASLFVKYCDFLVSRRSSSSSSLLLY